MNEQTKELDDSYVESSVEDARANKFVVAPVLEFMKTNELRIPSIDNLILAIDLVYQTGMKPRNLEHCYQQAWAIRRIIQQVKSFLYKESPPQDCK